MLNDCQAQGEKKSKPVQRGHYVSPIFTARNNAYAVLRADPAFKRLALRHDDVRRVLAYCQREKLLCVGEYRTADRKQRERWCLTDKALGWIADCALSALSAPS